MKCEANESVQFSTCYNPIHRFWRVNQKSSFFGKYVTDNVSNRKATKKISFSSLLLMILTKEEIYPKREKTMNKLLGVGNKT